MSNNQENVVEIDEYLKDDAPIISFNVPKIKRLAKKALPYAVAGVVTLAAGMVAMMLSPDDSEAVESSEEALPEFIEFEVTEPPVVEETTED